MEFQRFVSYIYRYEGGQKLENAGFAKVELNNDVLKIRIHVRLPGNPQDICQIYLFTRNGDKIAGVLLGENRVKNKKLEADFQTNGKNIMEQEVSFSQLKGIFLKTNGGLVYASAWDDSLIDTEQFSLYNKEVKSDGVLIKEEQIEEKQVKEEKQEPVQKEDEKVKIEEEIIEQKQIEEEKVEQNQIEEIIVQQKPVIDQDKVKTSGKETLDVEEALDVKGQEFNKEECEDLKDDRVNWNQLIQSCPAVRPFKYQDIGKYIRIEPKELWHLPKKEWVLGSNSFLLHGYYSYRYLIFGKYDEQHYVIGVPGRFYHQEQDMAKMFGFEQFRPVAGNRITQGQFGYWCKEVVCDTKEYCS